MRWPAIVFPLVLIFLTLPVKPFAQTERATPATLPDIPSLMRDVAEHERAAEEIRKHYTYKSALMEEKTDDKGQVKKTERTVSEVFYQDGVQASRVLEKDGHPLSDSEKAKQNDEVARQIKKSKQREEKKDDQITISRILELGSFSNPRRILYKGRSTILADYTGNPDAKTRTRFEDIFKRLAGTVWIDEETRSLVRGEGRFAEGFKIGGGLVANVHQGLHFYFEAQRVNGEVWLPAEMGGEGVVRIMLFFKMQGREKATFYDYKRFSGTMRILPGAADWKPDAPPQSKP